MGMDEFIDWQAYCLLEPFGGDIGFLQSGIIASTIANVNRGKNKAPYKASDFMPDYSKRFLPPKKQSTKSIKKFMMGLVKATKKGKGKKKNRKRNRKRRSK